MQIGTTPMTLARRDDEGNVSIAEIRETAMQGFGRR